MTVEGDPDIKTDTRTTTVEALQDAPPSVRAALLGKGDSTVPQPSTSTIADAEVSMD